MKKIRSRIQKISMLIVVGLLASTISVTCVLAENNLDNEIATDTDDGQTSNFIMTEEFSGASDDLEFDIPKEVDELSPESKKDLLPEIEPKLTLENVKSGESEAQAQSLKVPPLKTLNAQTRTKLDDLEWLSNDPDSYYRDLYISDPWPWVYNNGIITWLPEGIVKAEFIEDTYVKGKENYHFDGCYGRYVPSYLKVTKDDGSVWIADVTFLECDHDSSYISKYLLDEDGNETELVLEGATFRISHDRSDYTQDIVAENGHINLSALLGNDSKFLVEPTAPTGIYTLKEIQGQTDMNLI